MGNKNQHVQQSQQFQHKIDYVKDFLYKNGYEYIQTLSQKEQSYVIMAFSFKMQFQVAIKIIIQLKAQNQSFVNEFDKQMQILKQISKERYVLSIIEGIYDSQIGIVAIVMELCDSNLTQILDLNMLSIEQFKAITYQLLKGLVVLQENSISHNEIKPNNILYSRSKNQFFIADCGIPKLLDTNKQQQDSSVDMFQIGLLMIKAFIQRPLTKQEQKDLKQQYFFSVIPQLKHSKQNQFMTQIISNMIAPNNQAKIGLINLLQVINQFQINEDCLQQLKLQNEYRKFFANNIDDIQKGIHYDILEISLIRYFLISNKDHSKEIKRFTENLEKCQAVTCLSLNLGHNKLSLQGTQVICMGLEKCQNITNLSINLTQNNVCSQAVGYIGKYLEKCQKIISLSIDLSWNTILEEGVNIFGTSLKRCQNIKFLKLNLSNNSIQESAKYLGMSLESCQNIVSLNLDLSDNQVKFFGVKSILRSLDNCQNICSLSLNFSNNNIKEEQNQESISMEFIKCPNVTSLNLNFSRNEINPSIAKFIAQNLEKMENLTSLILNLQQNKIQAEGINYIAKSLAKCQKIKTLNLNLTMNQIQANGAKLLLTGLEECQNVVSLHLNFCNNSLKEEGAKNIANSLINLKKIKYLNLDLAENDIKYEGAQQFAIILKNCQSINLLYLNLRKSSINYQKSVCLKKIFQKMKRLVFVYLQYQS